MQLLIYLDLSLSSCDPLSFSEHNINFQKICQQKVLRKTEKDGGSVSSRNGKEASVARSGDIREMGIS